MPARWKSWLRPQALWRVAAGALVAWTVTAFLGVWLLLVPPFDQRNRITVAGALESVEVVALSEASHEVELRVANEQIRFRIASDVFEDVLGAHLPSQLQAGATITALVPVDEYQEPLHGSAHTGPTAYVDALTADGQEVFSLAQAQVQYENNRRIGLMLFPALLLGAVFLTLVAALRYRIWREDRSMKADED